MKRDFKIIDQSNGISLDISIDDEREFIEIWGMTDEARNGEPIIIIERRIYKPPYKKPPFAIYPAATNLTYKE